MSPAHGRLPAAELVPEALLLLSRPWDSERKRLQPLEAGTQNLPIDPEPAERNSGGSVLHQNWAGRTRTPHWLRRMPPAT
jgi:hypothetical protein